MCTSKTNKGFTLLEMVATIGIIAILASVLLPRYTQFTVGAKLAKSRMNLVSIKNGFAYYYYQNLLDGRTMEFPPPPADSQMTTSWSENTILATGQTPASLFSEGLILYNPNNHPYLYYSLPEDTLNNPGFGVKDPDFYFKVEFRP